jgi:hypothetical protein
VNLTDPTPRRLLRRLAVVPLLLLVLGACSDDDGGGGDQSSAEEGDDATATTGGGQTVMSIDVAPGTSASFVGARADVSELECERDDEGWQVGGTVTNPTDESASYRIYVSFLNAQNETRGLLQVDVDDVGGGDAERWEGRLDLEDEGLQCQLRVERSAGDEDGGE